MVPFFVTRNQYPLIESFSKRIQIIENDHVHIMGYVLTNTCEEYPYVIGADITNLPMAKLKNLWFSPSGVIYFVPLHGHSLVAKLLGFRSSEHAEQSGWLHYSYGSICNPCKITDRMYDAICTFSEWNNLDPAFFLRPSNY